MIKVSIQSQGEDLGTFISKVKEENEELNTKLISLGKEIHSFMQQVIVSNIKRPGSTGNLVRAIQFGILGEGSWFVGDIDYLNSTVPYWRWQNYGRAGTGRTVPPINRGYFSSGSGLSGDKTSPMSGIGSQRWTHEEGGRYLIKPMKALTPMNYIEKSIFLLNSRLEDILKSGTKTIFGSGFSMSENF